MECMGGVMGGVKCWGREGGGEGERRGRVFNVLSYGRVTQ